MGLFGPRGEKEYKKGCAMRSAYVYGERKDPGDIDAALKHLDTAIAKGYSEALLEKARIYANGEGNVQADPAYALQLRRQAYEKGLRHAAYAIAEQYKSGTGTPVDMAKAFAYLKGAAEDGTTAALARLAECYIYGYGCEISAERANEYLERAERAVRYDWERSEVYEKRGKLALTEAGGCDTAAAEAFCRRIEQNNGYAENLRELIEAEQLLRRNAEKRGQAEAHFSPCAPGRSAEIEGEPDDQWFVRCSFRKKEGTVKALLLGRSGELYVKAALRFLYVPHWDEYYVELSDRADGSDAALWQYVVAGGKSYVGQTEPLDLAELAARLGADVCVTGLPEGYGLECLNYN